MKFPFKIKLTGFNRGDDGNDFVLFNACFFWRFKGYWRHVSVSPELATNPLGEFSFWKLSDKDGFRNVFLLGVYQTHSPLKEHERIRCFSVILGPILFKFGVAL